MGLWTNSIERIMERFVVKTDSCWLWLGKKDFGYGRVGFNGSHVRAHKLIYEGLKGPVPTGLVLDHLCRNRGCVNPDHLEPISNRENVLRGVGLSAENAKKTHCKHGHAFEGANLLIVGAQRQCRTCRLARSREWKRKRRELAA